MAALLASFPISVDQYHAMIAKGILGPDDKVELIHGRLEAKMSKHPPHSLCNRKIDLALSRAAPNSWHVRNQDAVTLGDSEPEPDILIVRGKLEDYGHRHPGASEVGLVVEVADSSLARDRSVKRWMYAQAGIPVYWIANLVDMRIEAYSEPSGGDYTVRCDYVTGEFVPLILDKAGAGPIAVDSLLP